MAGLADFSDIVQVDEPLAPCTGLKLGGPADYLVQPRSHEELAAVVRACKKEGIPFRPLGGGCNVLVPDEGVRGAVLRLSEPVFSKVTVQDKKVQAGAGATFSALISEAARHSLAGLEELIGIKGTLGGALRSNAGERISEISRFVRRVEVLTQEGEIQSKEGDELRFGGLMHDLEDPILLTVELELEKDDPDLIVKRMRKAWILRKASQPYTYQAAGRLFQNPKGLSASALIEQAGLVGAQVGGVEVSERDANYLVVHPEKASSRDVLRLIDLIRSKVREQFHVDLELELTLW